MSDDAKGISDDANGIIGRDPAMEVLLNIFSGIDGGSYYVSLCQYTNVMRERASRGERQAIAAIDLIDRFCKLAEIVVGYDKEKWKVKW